MGLDLNGERFAAICREIGEKIEREISNEDPRKAESRLDALESSVNTLFRLTSRVEGLAVRLAALERNL